MTRCPKCAGRMKRHDGVKVGNTSTRIYACESCGAAFEVTVTETVTVRPAVKRYLRSNSVYRDPVEA